MAEAQRRVVLPAGLSTRFGSLSENRLVAFALEWYGIPLAAAFGLVFALYYLNSPAYVRPIFDDSYISLNFARNLVEHGKLTFDGEEWTTGATSPLHVTIMAAWLAAGVPEFYASMGVGLVSQALLAVGVYLMGVTMFHSRLAGLLGALAISVTGYALLDAGNGLETSLFMALIAFATAAYFWDHGPLSRLACGVLVGLAVLTRPEGAFLIPAFVIYRWVDRTEGESLKAYATDAARLAVPGLFAGGLIALFSLIVSGSLGGTGGAKLAFFQEDEASLQHKFSVAADQIGLFIGPIIPLIALAAVVTGRKALILVALFWIPVLVFYALLFPGGLSHYFYRYQHPILPFVAVFAGAGMALLLTLAWRRDFVVKALVVAAAVLVVVPMYEQYNRWRDIYTDSATATYLELEAMAVDLNSIVEEDETLATHDIGAVQYFADYEVLDLVGLANEEVIPYHEDRQVSRYMDLVRPEYLLVFPDWDVFFLHLDAANRPEQYELVKSYPGGNAHGTPYMLYRVHYE